MGVVKAHDSISADRVLRAIEQQQPLKQNIRKRSILQLIYIHP